MKKPKIKKVSVARWCTALRDGSYKQGRQRLRTRTGHCCLGVAADLAAPNLWTRDGSDWRHDRYSVQVPTRRIFNAFNLRKEIGEFTWDEKSRRKIAEKDLKLAVRIDRQAVNSSRRKVSLAQLNDAGFTFEEIALVIESRPTKLFKQAKKTAS